MFKLKQFVLSGFCLKCAGCCRFDQEDTIWSPRLLNKEKERLGKKIHLIPNPKQGNFLCSFLNIQNNKCKTYSFRPFECQLYPFLINRKEEDIFLAVDLKCPFVKKNLKDPRFKEYTQYLNDFLNSPRQLNILKNNPQIIQVYTEVLNLTKLKI